MDDEELYDMEYEYLEVEQISDSLYNAYINNSDSKLKSFLDAWNIEIQPNNISEISDENTKNVYLIFKELFNPFNLEKLGTHEWGSTLYEGLEYIIVQNKIYYDFNFDNADISEADSIVDFRPDVSFRNVKTLYLTKNYELALNTFLGSDFCQTVSLEVNAPFVPVEESYNRMQFLNQELSILPSRSGSIWHIETHPYISTIHFDEKSEKAFVNFRLGYMFGEALMEKKNGAWEISSSIINSIE
jgi:hypothetical protein